MKGKFKIIRMKYFINKDRDISRSFIINFYYG